MIVYEVKEPLLIDSLKNLVSSIIEQAIEDLINIKPIKIKLRETERKRNRASAKKFFQSKLFVLYCDFLKIESSTILKKVNKYLV